MIVTCSGCRTRFRVADEKVGPRGARLRCTRCKAVITVQPSDAAETRPVALPDPAPSAAAHLASAAGVVAPSPADDPFAFVATDDPFAAPIRGTATDGNFAVAGEGLQIPAPGLSAPAPQDPAALLTTPPGFGAAPTHGPTAPLDSLALEESDRPARPAIPPPVEPPAPSPGPLDFDAFDFATEPSAPAAPQAAPAAAKGDPSAPEGVDPLDGLTFGPPVEAPALPPVPPAAPAPPRVPTPAPAPAPPPAEPDGARARPWLRSAGVNLLSLAALLVVAGALFASWRGRPALFAAADGPVAATVTSSALYETSSGRAVLVIRGEVRSRANEPVAARVAVELVDGGRVVARVTAVPGAVPSPEEAYAVDGPAAAERLASSVAARAPARLDPGSSAPFGVVLAEPPSDLSRIVVRASASVR
jgi:predicted Zn finger-like uncharacterized protein